MPKKSVAYNQVRELQQKWRDRQIIGDQAGRGCSIIIFLPAPNQQRRRMCTQYNPWEKIPKSSPSLIATLCASLHIYFSLAIPSFYSHLKHQSWNLATYSDIQSTTVLVSEGKDGERQVKPLELEGHI